MHIAIASDLHLEWHDWPVPVALLDPLAAGAADVLVLAGNASLPGRQQADGGCSVPGGAAEERLPSGRVPAG